MCTKQEFCREVKKIDNPAKAGFLVARQYSKAIVVAMPEGERIVNFTSPTYELHPNNEWVSLIENYLNQNHLQSFEAHFSHIDWARYYATWRIKSPKDFIVEGNFPKTLMPTLTVFSSYNDLIAFKVVAGWYDPALKCYLYTNKNTSSSKHTRKQSNYCENLYQTLIDFNSQWNRDVDQLVHCLYKKINATSLNYALTEIASKIPAFPKKLLPSIHYSFQNQNLEHNRYNVYAMMTKALFEHDSSMALEVRFKLQHAIQHFALEI